MNDKAARILEYGFATIGTHWDGRAKGLGDVVIVTALIRELKVAYPFLNIEVKVQKYLEVFDNNPHVVGVGLGTGENSETNIAGHYITKLCDWFGVYPTRLYGELYPTSLEQEAICFLTERARVLVHLGNPLQIPKMDVLLAALGSMTQDWEVIQMDMDTYRGIHVPSIPGATQSFRNCSVRTLISCLSFADFFVGVNSGPMHIAACYQIPSLIYASPVLTLDMIYPQHRSYKRFDEYVTAIKQNF